MKCKKIVWLCFAGFFFYLSFSSCASRYTAISPKEVNKTIAYDVSIVGPAELMYFVYPYPDNHNVHIDWKELRKKNNYKITLTHTNLKDDSVEAYKYIVFAKYNGTTWEVFEIKRTHRCREGRGKTRWTRELCL